MVNKKPDKKRLVGIIRFGIGAVVLGLLVVIGFVVGKALTTPTVEDPYEKALAALEQHAYGEAYYYLNQELEVNPDHTEAYLDLSNLLVMKNRHDEALVLLNNALEQNVEKPRIREALAALYLNQRMYKQSEEQFASLISSSSEYAATNKSKYYYNYYLTLLRQQKLEKAYETLQSIRDKFSESEWYYKAIYELVLWEIDDPETRTPLMNILSSETKILNDELKNIEVKIEEAKDAASNRDLAEQNGWYGIILLENERCELATPFFEKAIELGDTYGVYAKAHHYSGVCLYQLSEFEDALSELNVALKEDPTDLDAWLYKAYTCEALGQKACVLEAFDKLTTVDANNTAYIETYSDYLLSIQEYSKALDQLKALYNASTKMTGKTAVAERIVDLAFDIEEYSGAAEYLESMDTNSADYYAYKGRLKQLSDGSNLSGKNEFLEALKIDPYHAPATYYLALVEEEHGNREGAADLAAKAIDYDLEGSISEPARELLEEVSSII